MAEKTSHNLLPYKFSIFYKAIVHIYDNENNIPDDTRFYNKQTFTAYLRTDTREKMSESCETLYALANSALYDDKCDLLTEGEYVEDDNSDKFICFINDVETIAWAYLEENDVSYNYDGSTSTQFAHWN
jgi:hypothetical protein